ncbi:hypothetical protein, partial [Agathobaculum butyriciproducens]|uniref:hypothetical protein n=1 Tax=Agathobaculum butyriciproducens TaxID=1628085 RepID=UPI003AB232AD
LFWRAAPNNLNKCTLRKVHLFGYAVSPFAAQAVCLPLFGLLPWKSAEIFCLRTQKEPLILGEML